MFRHGQRFVLVDVIVDCDDRIRDRIWWRFFVFLGEFVLVLALERDLRCFLGSSAE